MTDQEIIDLKEEIIELKEEVKRNRKLKFYQYFINVIIIITIIYLVYFNGIHLLT